MHDSEATCQTGHVGALWGGTGTPSLERVKAKQGRLLVACAVCNQPGGKCEVWGLHNCSANVDFFELAFAWNNCPPALQPSLKSVHAGTCKGL